MNTTTRTTLLGVSLIALSAAVAAAQPPPLGPPPNQTEKGNLAVSVMTRVVRGRAQTTVNETNARLKADGESARVSIESLRAFGPRRDRTVTPHRPNSSFIRVPYFLGIKVDLPLPLSDRHIHIPIDVDAFCVNWHTGRGSITVQSRPGPASIEGGSIIEDVIQVRNHIDAKVQNAFTPPLPVSVPLNSPCSSLGMTDLATETVNDDAILWDVPRIRPFAPVGTAVQPMVEVTFDRLRRLKARELPGGGILYQEVEQIRLNAFANYTQLQKALSMREGDDVALNLPTVRLPARTFDSLVVIGHIEQPPDNPKDSTFAAAARTQSYRPGPHVLQIPKWYSEFDALLHRPLLRSVPAYELSYTVRFIDPGVVAPAP